MFEAVTWTMIPNLTMWTHFWCTSHAIGTFVPVHFYTFHWTIVVSLQSHSPHCVWVHLVALSILQSTTHACVLLNNTWTNLETCHTGGVIRPISHLPDSFLAVATGTCKERDIMTVQVNKIQYSLAICKVRVCPCLRQLREPWYLTLPCEPTSGVHHMPLVHLFLSISIHSTEQ